LYIGPKLTENSATDPGGGMVGGVVIEVHFKICRCTLEGSFYTYKMTTSILIVQSSVQGKCTNLGLLRCDTTYYMDGHTKATAFATPANVLCLTGMELDPLTPMPM
jgi:hypothetical protein